MAKRQKTTRFSIKDFDMAHYRATEQYANAVDNLFAIATEEIARAASKADFNPDKPFTFDDYPKVKSAMQTIVAGLTKKVQAVVETGSRKQWLFSCKKNDAFIKSVFDTTKLKKSDLKQMMDKRLDALATFQGRKVAGMNLSQRVWKYTTQFREQIEHALDVGLGEGRSAQELSRDVRQNLKDPNRLFRRVRDKRGNLVLSKAAQAFHPGQGVYRSSYKNAMRLTRSEINMAYRESDYQRWQALDFVVGFEIMRSNHEPLCKCSTCEKLVGRYPKTFKFVGWHPQCMCFAIPIMEDFYSEGRRNDRVNRLKAALNGTTAKKYISPETIDKMPDGFNEWVDAHKDAQKNWSSTPYFIRDNFKNGNLADGLKITFPVVPASVKIDPLAALMPSIENARQLATKWGITIQLNMLEKYVAVKDITKIQSYIATIQSKASIIEQADKDVRAKCAKWGLSTYILDQAMQTHDSRQILKAQSDLETRCFEAEAEYKSYLNEASKAINDAHTAKIDATDVKDDLDAVKADLREWAISKANIKQRLANLLSKLMPSLNAGDEAILDDVVTKCKTNGVDELTVGNLDNQLSETDIVKRLGGGDMTSGSCSSLALAYAGNRCGFDVLDFRGGKSCDFFSRTSNIVDITKKLGGVVVENYSDFDSAKQLLKQMKEGKEYYFTCGKHAAIVRKTSTGYEFLELQSHYVNGFKTLDNSVLKNRFGAQKSHSLYGRKYKVYECLIPIDTIKQNTASYKKMLAYINTKEKEQKKGKTGTIK